MLTKAHYSFIARLGLMLSLLVGMLGTQPERSVLADTLVVTNTNDSGADSLRQAIANATSGDTITFDSGLSGRTIHLISTLTLSEDVTIDGSALASQITISGDDLNRVFYINSGVTVTLDSLIIAHGKSPYGSMGGGIFNAGVLTVANSTISENSAFYGGGIFNDGGALTLIDSTLSYNNAYMEGGGLYSQGGTVAVSNSTLSNNSVSFTGGGIYNAGGTVTVNNSIFSDNIGDPLMSSYAGGIYNTGTLTISDSTFSNNSAEASGGGIFHSYGTLTITNSIFSGNSSRFGGGIINNTTLIIANSTFSGNSAGSGGAIYNNGTLGMLTVTDSTFSGNSALDGGGIFNYGTLTVTNSTVSGNGTSSYGSVGGGISNYNTATVMDSTFFENFAYYGGGIYNWDAVTVTNSTFSGNEAGWGGGIANSGNIVGGTLTVRNSTFYANDAQHGGGIANIFMSYQNSILNYVNTIIAKSTSGGDCYNVGDIGTNINNLVEDGSCSASMSGDPNLAPLADNGGPTPTMALLPDSPAIDAGQDTSCPDTDQRGVTRPQGDHCDIGAYEVRTLTVTKTNDTNDGVCDADCSLREAILEASASDRIIFAPLLAGGTIVLNSQLTIDKNLTIDGSGLNPQLVLSGGDAFRIMQLIDGNVSISELTFTKGFSTAGGAIDIIGNSRLTLKNSMFFQNRASLSGGAISVLGNGSIAINNSTFLQNQAGGSGGAIEIGEYGTNTIVNSTFSENHASGNGGAISGANITLIDSTLSRNIAVGGGGAIYGGMRLDIIGTTISHNQASGGGAIEFIGVGDNAIINSTITQNQANVTGGAIFIGGTTQVEVFNSSIAHNNAPQASEVSASGVTVVSLFNTILACVPGNSGCIYQSGNAIVGGPNSIIETGTLVSFGLAELANNGGPTQTMALLPGSPLINAGDDSVCANSYVNHLDQRGVARPQGSGCDIGAYEVEVPNSAPMDIALSPFSVNENQPAGTTVGILSTTDPDTGDSHAYAFCGGTNDASFSISGNVLKTAVVFDYETNASYSVCLRSTDSGNLSTTKTFVIGVNDLIDTQTFDDVSSTYWAWNFIERLYDAGITGGCQVNPLAYCPEESVTRAQMAIFLLRGIHGTSYNPPAVGSSTGFSDVPTTYWAAAWIKQLAAEGVTGGCGAGTYCPESPVTRAQMAVFLLRSKYGPNYSPPAAGGGTGFGDVQPTQWAAAWIKQLVAEGITAGCGQGNYCPETAVNRAQMAVFLVKTFNLP